MGMVYKQKISNKTREKGLNPAFYGQYFLRELPTIETLGPVCILVQYIREGSSSNLQEYLKELFSGKNFQRFIDRMDSDVASLCASHGKTAYEMVPSKMKDNVDQDLVKMIRESNKFDQARQNQKDEEKEVKKIMKESKNREKLESRIENELFKVKNKAEIIAKVAAIPGLTEVEKKDLVEKMTSLKIREKEENSDDEE